MDTSELTQLRDEVARLRKDKQNLDDEYNMEFANWHESHETLIQRIDLAKHSLVTSEEQLRQAAVAHYNETGQRKPVEGIEVKLATRLEYDADKALGWCETKHICLILDSKAFEKLPVGVRPGFVLVIDEPKAYIAKHLSEEAKHELP